jgi:aspartyl-tRNA(Asn)/glutamyl-tRNA(Gln) amidotransferase subunit A
MKYVIKQKILDLHSGKLTAAENIKNFLKTIKEKNKKINAILFINNKAAEEAEKIDKKIRSGKAGRLAGLAIAVKSNISVADMPVSCASKTLENYKGTFDADVIRRIKEEDGIIIGMANMDEFAAGISGETSAFGPTINPAAPERIPGGSSSGSAAAVAAGMCDLALGSDTGGSIRNPASHCSIFGVKPSYGRVSRFGLIDLAMSLDQIGPLSSDAYGCALLLEAIAGKSEYDAVSFERPVPKYTAELKKPASGLKIGMSAAFKDMCSDKRIYELIEKKAEEFAKKTNSNIKNINLKNVELAVQTYYPIVYVEFFSGTRKFDGRKYGKKIEGVCGEEVLRRILGGREISRAEYAGRYYRKALMAKSLITKSFEEAFRKVDVIMLPTTPELPHKLGKMPEPKAAYAYDAYTCPANIAGICAGVAPAGRIDNTPVGLQIMAPAFKEDLLLRVMNGFE